ncbi:hypothetical protein BC332_19307 [Capsicum chinense]|nr:hypothetical protein BC332_19307 [Capsicum chinense]
MYENKDKMDEVWINYCGMPVCFGWKEFAIVIGLKCYPPSPSQVIPTLTQKKHLAHPKKEKCGLIVVDDGSGSGAAVRANDAPLTVFETKNHYDYDHTGCTDFALDFSTSSECSASKYQDCKAKHNGVINAINAITISVDVTVEATAKEHNITVDNPSNSSKEEEKVEPISLGERKNYLFEGFTISDEAPEKLTHLINDYLEWIADGLLKDHAGRDCGLFVAAYTNYLSDGLQVPNDGLDSGLLHKIYASLLWKYGEAKSSEAVHKRH